MTENCTFEVLILYRCICTIQCSVMLNKGRKENFFCMIMPCMEKKLVFKNSWSLTHQLRGLQLCAYTEYEYSRTDMDCKCPEHKEKLDVLYRSITTSYVVFSLKFVVSTFCNNILVPLKPHTMNVTLLTSKSDLSAFRRYE